MVIFYALGQDGKVKWKHDLKDVILSSPAMDSKGSIYVGCLDCNLYAF